MKSLFVAFIVLGLSIGYAQEKKQENKQEKKQDKKSEHREHSAHEHGVGELNITFIDSMVINAEIRAPAESFVGFEHKAKSGEDKKTVREVYNLLKDPKNVFAYTDAADCKLNLFSVRGVVFEGVKDVIVAPPEPGHKHNKHDKHSEVEIEYSLQCFKGDKLKDLTTSLFKNFKHLKSIKATTLVKEKPSTAVLTQGSEKIPGL